MVIQSVIQGDCVTWVASAIPARNGATRTLRRVEPVVDPCLALLVGSGMSPIAAAWSNTYLEQLAIRIAIN